jgi:hypothetical protein
MPEPTLDALEKKFSEVIDKMDRYFDSHDFILKLAQMHQRLYVAALAAYVDKDYPFQIVHSEIARRLLNHPKLAVKVGEDTSEDIFRQKNSAILWRKVQ